MLILGRCALVINATAMLLVGCGRSQLPIDAQSAMPQTAAPATHGGNGKYKVLLSFSGNDGGEPQAGLIDVDGVLYGTTEGGGTYGLGTVFAINLSGEENVLHSFGYGTDGFEPLGSLIDVNGVFYGTTVKGGGTIRGFSNCCGTVFSITKSGTEKVLHVFGTGTGADGWWPFAGLTNVDGTLYGTTANGGGSGCGDVGCGTVFSITTNGTEKVLHSFGGGNDGALPYASLIVVHGRLYGTTAFGGEYDAGTVFSVSTSGKEKVLHSFNDADGSRPLASLIDFKGSLFGTTSFGGAAKLSECGSVGCGTVFKTNMTGQEKVVLSFGGADGAYPEAGLVYFDGTFYGTTSGGAHMAPHCLGSGCGTLFSVSPNGNETVLHTFGRHKDGYWPNAVLTDVNGTLYGTTPRGGTFKQRPGAVFALTP